MCSELGELDSQPGLDVVPSWAEEHKVVIALCALVADWALVVVGSVEANEAELCWELVVVVIPHQLTFGAPYFGHPLPYRRPVQLGACGLRSNVCGVGD